MRRHDLPAAAVPAATPPAKDRAAKDAAAASASPAPADAPAAGAAPAARRPIVLDRRLAAVIGAAVACVVIAVVLGMARHRGSDSAAHGRCRCPGARRGAGGCAFAGPVQRRRPGPRRPARPAAVGSRRRRRLRHNGEWEQALAVLHQARRETPGDADVDYLLADIYLEHHRPLEGIAAAQSAIRKNPALKSDGDLVNAVIESLAKRQDLRPFAGLFAGTRPCGDAVCEGGRPAQSQRQGPRASRGNPAGRRWAKVGIWVEPALVVKPFP